MGDVDITHTSGHVEHRGHRIWYDVAGSGSSDGAPLLLIHGGPGIPHDYLMPLEALADERRVVFYDQYGCGLSDRAEDPSSYTIELFVDELAHIQEELGLGQVHLLAHSYGGPLALEYLLRNPGHGVRSLVLSNSFASVPGLLKGWEQRLNELPPDQAASLRGGDASSSPYQAALGTFIDRFVLAGPPPDLLMEAQAKMGAEVYAAMHGSSWFNADGCWAGWDATARLRELDLPVLVISGMRDQCVPALGRAIADRMECAELQVLDSAHMPMFECTQEYIALIRDFLGRHDLQG
jgi:proline-specific peptidase